MGRITELEDRIRLLEVFIDENNLISVTIASNVPLVPDNEYMTSGDDITEHGTYDCLSISNMTPAQQPINSKRISELAHNVGDSALEAQSFNDDISSRNNVYCDTTMQTHDSETLNTNAISVRITSRDERVSHQDDFEIYRRKRTKHYCVLGLSKNVNTSVLSSVVSQKGLNVTNIAVFPMRNNPNKVIVKLNIRDNDQSERVLDDGFWPSYVSCRPWRSKSALQRFIPPRIRRNVDWRRYNNSDQTSSGQKTNSFYNTYNDLSNDVE
ncbi:hypothetical protein ACF0H5_020365 [Mactra antiquata]